MSEGAYTVNSAAYSAVRAVTVSIVIIIITVTRNDTSLGGKPWNPRTISHTAGLPVGPRTSCLRSHIVSSTHRGRDDRRDDKLSKGLTTSRDSITDTIAALNISIAIACYFYILSIDFQKSCRCTR